MSKLTKRSKKGRKVYFQLVSTGAPCLSDMNKAERLMWCMRYIKRDFSDYLFVDETTVRFFEVPLYQSRKSSPVQNTPVGIPSTSKYRLKLNICGGISCSGPTQFIVRVNYYLTKIIVIHKICFNSKSHSSKT